jgi:hemerythrin superfamily protein
MHQGSSGTRARIDRALRTMEGQHVRLHEFYVELDQALLRSETSAAKTWLTRLISALQAHFELEETIVFPALSELDPKASAVVARLQKQHRSVISELETLLEASHETLNDAVPELRRNLASHESDEESIVRLVLSGESTGPTPKET